MDEILESIRRIVFEEDGRPPGPGAGVSDADAPAAEAPAAEAPAAEVPAAEVPAAATGRAAGEETAQPAGTDAPPDNPPPVVETPVETTVEPLPAVEPAIDDEAAGGVGAGPGETILLLTDMIAPDGSVVRLDPRPADAPPAPDAAAGAGAGSGEGAGEGALDPATQSELAATVREWLDRNAPELVDRAARRELQERSDRRD